MNTQKILNQKNKNYSKTSITRHTWGSANAGLLRSFKKILLEQGNMSVITI